MNYKILYPDDYDTFQLFILLNKIFYIIFQLFDLFFVDFNLEVN